MAGPAVTRWIGLSSVLALAGLSTSFVDGGQGMEPRLANTTRFETRAGTAGPDGSPCPATAKRVAPDQSIAQAARSAPPRTAFCLASGVHRAQTVAPKDGQSFFGERGAVMSGARPLGPFRPRDGTFVAEGFVLLGSRNGVCLPESPLCDRLEQGFLDGLPLEETADLGDLRDGLFYFDRERNEVVLSVDPGERAVEMTASVFAFLSNHARDVTISNLTIERYGSPAQHGTVFEGDDAAASGWTVSHNLIRQNSGLGLIAGPKSTLSNNQITDNGQLGVSLSGDDSLVIGNEIARNGWRGYDPTWERGGLKGALAKGVVIRGNDVHDNHGPGLWCDIECADITYEGNFVENNEGAGIFHEISYRAVVRSNRLVHNGLASNVWFWGANILIAASENVLVEDNDIDVAPGGTGIALVDQGRERDGQENYLTRQNTIRGNRLRFEGAGGRTGGVSDVLPGFPNYGIVETGGNRFEKNIYAVPKGAELAFAFGWRVYGGLDEFRDHYPHQEVGSRLVEVAPDTVRK